MPKKSKFFRVAVEGQTLKPDIYLTRAEIESMAADYSLDVYTARNNLEHLLSVAPDSLWGTYGKVLALETEEIQDGLLKGKLALLAQVEITEELESIQKKGRKLTTSIEYTSNFPATGRAYLMRLSFTDSPASLGTQEIKLSLEQKNLVMSEPVEINLSVNEPDLLSRITQKLSTLLSRSESTETQQAQTLNIVEMLTDNAVTTDDTIKQLTKQYTALAAELSDVQGLKETVAALSAELSELKQELSTTDSAPARSPATGGETASLTTDC